MSDDTDFIMKVSSSEYSGPSGAGDRAHGPSGVRRDSRVELKVPTITRAYQGRELSQSSRENLMAYFAQSDPDAEHIIQGLWAPASTSYPTHGFDN